MRRFAAVLVALLTVACGNKDGLTAPVGPTFVGTWALESMDSKRLPIVLEQYGNDKIELMDAGLTVVADGSFTAVVTERTTLGGEVSSQSYTDPGSYRVSGPIVTLTFSADGFVVLAMLVGDSLIFTNGTRPLIYRRK